MDANCIVVINNNGCNNARRDRDLFSVCSTYARARALLLLLLLLLLLDLFELSRPRLRADAADGGG